MKRIEMLFGVLRVFCDALAVALALFLAYSLRIRNIDLLPGVQLLDPATTLPTPPAFLRTFVLPSIFLFLILATLLKLYLIRITLGVFRELSRIVLAVVVWVGCIMGWYFFVRHQLFYSRILLLHATAFLALFTGIGRILLTLLQRKLLRSGIGTRTVLSLGAQPLPEHVEHFLKKDPRYKYLGHIHAFDGVMVSSPNHDTVDLLLHTDPSSSDETNRIIDFCRSHHIGYAFLPPILTDVPHLLSVYRFGSVPVLRFHPTPLDGWGAIYKRATDILLALLFLILLAPLFLLFAIIIKFDSHGPVLYRSKRVGQGRAGSNFQYVNILKMRSMVENADALKGSLELRSHRNDGPLFKVKDDPRVTRVGRFLRGWTLDELPQLWNVLRGDLSLVGPRPHLPEEVAKYTDFQKRVFAVKPGMTGLSQISGRSDLKFEDEVRLDLQYIEEWSPWLDLFILWRTLGVVLRREGAD